MSHGETPAALLELRTVTRVHGEGPTAVHALRGVSVAVAAGELVAVMGPSGSGKSTLLNLAGGLDSPTDGHVAVEGVELGGLSRGELAAVRRRSVGYVFQELNLVPALTAAENVSLPRELDGVRPRAAQAEALEALAEVEMEELAGRFPDDMSGGQQQRVAIARALVGPRRLLLADEPTGALDSQTGEAVLRLLRARCDSGAGGVLVTHEARHAAWAERRPARHPRRGRGRHARGRRDRDRTGRGRGGAGPRHAGRGRGESAHPQAAGGQPLARDRGHRHRDRPRGRARAGSGGRPRHGAGGRLAAAGNPLAAVRPRGPRPAGARGAPHSCRHPLPRTAHPADRMTASLVKLQRDHDLVGSNRGGVAPPERRVSPLRATALAAVTVLALGLGACGGEAKPLPYEAGSDPLALRAVQVGPGAAIMSVHWVGRSCSEVGVEPDEENPRKIVIVLDQPREARCSGGRSAQTIPVPIERDIGDRRIVVAQTKKVLALATCRAPGDVPRAIKRSICRVERRARGKR